MFVHLVADREPYLSYIERRDPGGFLLFCPEAEAELEVLPAERLLAPEGGERPGKLLFAYGPVSLMAASFEAGCADFLRDPWSLGELAARAARHDRARCTLGGRRLDLRGASLSTGGERESTLVLSEHERRLIKLFIDHSGQIITRTAIALALWGAERPGSRSIDVLVSRLRARIELLIPGMGNRIASCRGFGYRFLSDACG
jgi:DNA-binding response OmpR family regulator